MTAFRCASQRLIPLLFPAMVTISSLKAADIPVAAPAKPGATPLNDAVAMAEPGDRLVIAPGVYRERVVVEKTLTLSGQAGAILDGTIPADALKWAPVEGELAGQGIYTAPVEKRISGLLVDGKIMAELRYDRAQKAGEWHWKTLLGHGPPLSGFKEIRGLWIYHPEEKRVYAHFENAQNPARLKLAFITSPGPLLTIAKAAKVVVEGLAFRGGSVAIQIQDGAADCVVRRCKVLSYENTGIELTKGAARCTVEECDVTRGSLEEWQPSLNHSRPNYEIWRIHKDVGNYDRVGIELIRAGVGNRIVRNRLDRVFDGICLGDYKAESLDKPAADPEQGRGTVIAENVIENTRDSGIELGVGCVEVEVRHNILRRTHGGLRFKVPRVGPVFVHHNHLIDGSPFNIWFSMASSPAEGYVYHNTIVGDAGPGLILSLKGSKQTYSAPKWHFLNNLVLSKEGFFDQYGTTPPVDFTASHNVSAGLAGRRPWQNPGARDAGSLYEAEVPHDADGKPAKGSAAVDAGMDLSTYWNGKPLPGSAPGYFLGKAPDAGADEVE